MSSPINTGHYSLTITGSKEDIESFLNKLADEEYEGGLSRSYHTPTGFHSSGCGNIEIYRKSLEKAYSQSSNPITYTLLWYNQETKKCGFDYHNGISLTHYDTTTEGRFKEDYESMKLDSTIKGKLAEFMLTQNIPEQTEDVPLERAGACGLSRVPAEEPKQMKYGSMDEANQKAMNVWATQGESAMLKHIMTKEDGTPMSYAESRMLYG